jgi:hypothetical protein
MAVSIKKSGANIHLQLVGETYDATYCGQTVVGVAQVPLSAVSVPCFSVLLQAAAGNGGLVYVGNLTHGCYVELPAGGVLTVPINDVEKVYVRAAGAGYVVNWMAAI